MAIEYDAAGVKTLEVAQKASIQATPLALQKKAHTRRICSARPSEIRETGWKRFKYEMGLRMKSTGRGKGKDRRKKWAQVEDVELEEIRSEEREA
jgi:hypothetical protein